MRTSAAEIGQGLVGVVKMCTAKELGLPYEQARVLLSHTDLTPDGGPTTASRQTYVTGNAVQLAARALRDSGRKIRCPAGHVFRPYSAQPARSNNGALRGG